MQEINAVEVQELGGGGVVQLQRQLEIARNTKVDGHCTYSPGFCNYPRRPPDMRRHQNTFFFFGLRVNQRAGYLSPPKQFQLTAQKKQFSPVSSPSRAESACRNQNKSPSPRAWLAGRLSSPPGREKATPEAHLFKRRRLTRNDFVLRPQPLFQYVPRHAMHAYSFGEHGLNIRPNGCLHLRILLLLFRPFSSTQRAVFSSRAPRLSLAADGSQSGSTCAPKPCVCCFSAPPRQH
ncbi:uncharacterized protein J3D65DRAFT_162990 [Phyllosticta citribraziliensis]|uniref:Uncharacterized protein n=1 Tax=Phyllosticta citribraziliensis TaxID=989973 RepID=A0ABR1L7Z2_9PEZI